MHTLCRRCRNIKKLVVGALLLLNGFVWPKWLGVDGWVQFVALLMVLGAFLGLVLPNKCPNCNAVAQKAVVSNPAKKSRKK